MNKFLGAGIFVLGSSSLVYAGGVTQGASVLLTAPASGQTQFGAADSPTPQSQTLSFQSVSTGTSNTSGVNTFILLSRGTGTGVSGGLEFEAAAAGGAGSTQNTYADILDYNISNPGNFTFNSAIIGPGTNGYRLRSFAPTCTSPNMIPNQADLATGYSATTVSGTLCLVVAGANVMDYAVTTAGTWTDPQPTTWSNATLKMSALATAAGANEVCQGAGGLLTVEPVATTCSGSAQRFKDNILLLNKQEALSVLVNLKPVSFQYKPQYRDQMGRGTHYGLVAEDVEKVAPWLVAYGKDGKTQGVKYAELPAWIIASLQQQEVEIRELKREVARLKHK